MTVKELIEILSKCDPDALVVRRDTDGTPYRVLDTSECACIYREPDVHDYGRRDECERMLPRWHSAGLTSAVVRNAVVIE